MLPLSNLSFDEQAAFLRVIQSSLSIERHKELLAWLNGELQDMIPHEIMLAAWGDFALGLIYVNITSSLPSVRTSLIERKLLVSPLQRLFSRWVERQRQPFGITFDSGALSYFEHVESRELARHIQRMRSAIVHGIKDERGRHDCLYMAIGSSERISDRSIDYMVATLPYIDTALRQVSHLPDQYHGVNDVDRRNGQTDHASGETDTPEVASAEPEISSGLPWDLSGREIEVMTWVCRGKTNAEIAQILDISFFTVKNHLQRIFKKLDVLNRAQAVAKFDPELGTQRDRAAS